MTKRTFKRLLTRFTLTHHIANHKCTFLLTTRARDCAFFAFALWILACMQKRTWPFTSFITPFCRMIVPHSASLPAKCGKHYRVSAINFFDFLSMKSQLEQFDANWHQYTACDECDNYFQSPKTACYFNDVTTVYQVNWFLKNLHVRVTHATMLYRIIPLYRSNIIRFTDDNEVDIPIFRTEEGRYLASCTYGEQYRYMCRILAAVRLKILIIPQHWVIPW